MNSSRLLNFLRNHTRLIKKQIKKTHHDPTRRSVHELRVTTRKLRASLWLLKHGSLEMNVKMSSALLQKLGKALGKVRELDVAIRDANHYHIKTKKLKKKRQIAQRDLFIQTNSKHRKKIAFHLDKTIAELKSHPEMTIHQGQLLLKKRIQSLASLPLKNENDFHKVRVAAKKTRYSLESLGKPTRPLQDLQDVLGKGHDLEVLQSLSKKRPRLQDETWLQYNKARRMIKPAIQFAVHELSSP